MPRPQVSPDNRRSEIVKFRCSPTEFNRIASKADMAGVNVSEFVRASALAKKITIHASTAPDFTTRNELRRIGNNLNQLAKAMNVQAAQSGGHSGGAASPALLSIMAKLDHLFTQWLEHEAAE